MLRIYIYYVYAIIGWLGRAQNISKCWSPMACIFCADGPMIKAWVFAAYGPGRTRGQNQADLSHYLPVSTARKWIKMGVLKWNRRKQLLPSLGCFVKYLWLLWRTRRTREHCISTWKNRQLRFSVVNPMELDEFQRESIESDFSSYWKYGHRMNEGFSPWKTF